MPGREYECGECRHHFRAPDGTPRDKRSLMCPACGSMDLNICHVARPKPTVMRAKTRTAVGGGRLSGGGASNN